MTKRDFLILLIKLFGLYGAVTTLFSQIPGSISYAFAYLEEGSLVNLILAIGLSLTLTLALLWILIFKANLVVDLFKLDRGFTEDRIDLGSLNSETVIKIGVFLIGGIMMIKSLPGLLSNLFWAFKSKAPGQDFTPKNQYDLGVSVLTVIIGFLLAINFQLVAKLFARKQEQ